MGTRNDDAKTEAHHPAQNAHADADPTCALRIQVFHGAPPAGAAGAADVAAAALALTAGAMPTFAASSSVGSSWICAAARIGMMRSGGGGVMPSSVRATISTRCGVS